MTLEAYADTIVPGEKRHPDDRAIAGATTGGGAVTAGAIELLEHPGTGISDALDSLAYSLNDHAEEYAKERELVLDGAVPPFVALPFEHRTALVAILTAPEHPEKQMWVSLALFSNMAFDSAAHLSTVDAFRDGHTGLLTIGHFPPDSDGLFRFPRFSYGRQLSAIHPDTHANGSLA
jgi:enediyne biosynthesis protein E8